MRGMLVKVELPTGQRCDIVVVNEDTIVLRESGPGPGPGKLHFPLLTLHNECDRVRHTPCVIRQIQHIHDLPHLFVERM